MEEPKDENKGEGNHQASASSSTDEIASTIGDTSVDLADPTDHRFELRDLSIRFPEGELSVVTGPTASGKTALLVRQSTFLPILGL